jgi:tetratricopeptide (TPR) repeat protein
MSFSLKRLIYSLSNNKHGNNPYERKFEYDFSNSGNKWQAFKFFKHKSGKIKSPFNITSESSYNANLLSNTFELGLKKSNCIAWVDIPYVEFQDHIIEAKIRLDSCGGYAASGIIFRMTDESSYYLALVSSKGYFRLDVVKDYSPQPIVAWTEVSDFDGTGINLKIITRETNMIFIVNDKWQGEFQDDSNPYGQLCFALASYTEINEVNETNEVNEVNTNKNDYICKAYLDYLSIDTRLKKIDDEYLKWTCESNINANERLRLAETFAVMGEASKALDQINRAWKRRDEVISNNIATAYDIRTRKELLLAAFMLFHLRQYKESEEYIDLILEQDSESTEKKLAYTQKLKILNELNRYEELKNFIIKHQFKINKDIDYYILVARCYWELKEYEESAESWNMAFEINQKNGIYAVNAANAFEFAGIKRKALKLYTEAGKIFLEQDNLPELSALMPKLLSLGSRNKEARLLISIIKAKYSTL